MILVIIIVAAWIVILAPSLMKRHSRTAGEMGSISHFHRQLRVLEHSAPEPIVAPAYRLHSVGEGDPASGFPEAGAVPVLSVVGADQLPRPALAFLGDELDVDTSGRGGEWSQDQFEAEGSAVPPSRMAAEAGARLRVRRRRRDALGVMAGIVVGSAVIGFVPGASPAWILTLLSGVALAVYVALLVHLRRMAEERERKLHYLKPEQLSGREPAGSPRVPKYMSGRYAHPSNQALLAR